MPAGETPLMGLADIAQPGYYLEWLPRDGVSRIARAVDGEG